VTPEGVTRREEETNMPTLMCDHTEREQRPSSPTMFLVHIHRPGAGAKDPALCGNRYGAYVEAEEDEAVPYVIGRVETLCGDCRVRQFTS
jgi:hypothetical protein